MALTKKARKVLKSLSADAVNRTHFTPRTETGQRLQLKLSAEDRKKIGSRNTTWKAIVTDQITGRRYLVRGASCGLPGCNCDAIATDVPEPILSDAERRTVIAALRFWQSKRGPDDLPAQANAQYDFSVYFQQWQPLTPTEIDSLCEKLFSH